MFNSVGIKAIAFSEHIPYNVVYAKWEQASMTIGIVLNESKAVDASALARMAGVFARGGARMISDALSLPALGAQACTRAELVERADVLIAFGGDGTLLRAARQAAAHGKGVLGVNLGRLGFLTEAELGELESAALAILRGDYAVEERMMLAAELPDGTRCHAVNDIAVTRNDTLSIVYTDIRINGESFDRYGGDGVLAASPTGSTAYSLSCGGPVISPRLACIALTPICPHSLRARPMVLGGDERVGIYASEFSGRARVDADGDLACTLEPGQGIEIMRSELKARFIRLRGHSFYSVLRAKLME